MTRCPIAPCHAASCREDRNGVYPRDVATLHGAKGQRDIIIVNLAYIRQKAFSLKIYPLDPQ